MRKSLLSILAVTMLLGAANTGFAQETQGTLKIYNSGTFAANAEAQPIVIVSFAGYDNLKSNINVIGRLGGNPTMADGLESMLKAITQGKGLAGLDAKRPWGVVVMSDGQMGFPTYGFLPVTDLKQLIDAAKTNPKLAKKIKPKDNGYEFKGDRGMLLQIEQKGDWAIVTYRNEKAANAPADPLKLFGDLPKKHDLAVRILVKNIPDFVRQMFVSQFQNMPGANKETIQEFSALAKDLDEVLIGWRIDQSTSKCYLDLDVTAKTGTKLADELAIVKPGKTQFAGLQMPDAAVTVIRTVAITDTGVAKAKKTMTAFHKSFVAALKEQNLEADQLKLTQKLADDVLAVSLKTLESKKADGGLALLLEPGASTVVVCANVADGDKLDNAFKQLITESKNTDPEIAKLFKLNAETYEGVRFHTFSAPMSDPKFVPFVGDTLDGGLGIADDKLMVAVGKNAAKTLKKVLDQSKSAAYKEVPAFELKASVAKIAKFIVELAKADADPGASMRAAMLVSALEKAGDKDHVILTSLPISQGMRLRVELEEGLLQAVSSVVPMLMPVGGGMHSTSGTINFNGGTVQMSDTARVNGGGFSMARQNGDGVVVVDGTQLTAGTVQTNGSSRINARAGVVAGSVIVGNDTQFTAGTGTLILNGRGGDAPPAPASK